MIVKYNSFKRAFPAMLAGLALFLTGCQAVTDLALKSEAAKKAMPEQFDLAEEYHRKGDIDRAYKIYDSYAKSAPLDDEFVPAAFHRMAEISLEKGLNKRALERLNTIQETYPGYDEMPRVDYQKAYTLYLLKEYTRSVDAGEKWLEEYPWNPLEGRVRVLMGDCLKELNDYPRAFKWWLEALSLFKEDPKSRKAVERKIHALIAVSSARDLGIISGYTIGTDYAPQIHHMLARHFMEAGELESAQRSAKAIMDSTSDPAWVSRAEDILEEIKAAGMIRKGALGCLLPLTGPFAIYGQEVLRGIQTGMGLFTDSGGHPSLELVIRDTGGSPGKALKALENLVMAERVMAVIGPLSMRCARVTAEAAQQYGVPLLQFSQKKGITQQRDMVFRNFLIPEKEVERILSAAAGEMKIRRYAILYPDNAYGRYLMNLFWDRADEWGGVVTAVESYGKGVTDFAEPIKKMIGLYYPRSASVEKKLDEIYPSEDEKGKEKSDDSSDEPRPIIDFEAVFLPDNSRNVAMIAAHLAYHDVENVQLLGTSLWQSPDLIKLGGDYLQGAIFPSGFSPYSDRPGVAEFVKSYEENFDSEPGVLAATGYDTIRFMGAVMAQSGVNTRKDLREAIQWSRGFSGVTGTIFFDFQGEVEKLPLLMTVAGGKLEIFRDY